MKTDWRAMLELRLERVTNIFADGKIKTNVLHALPFWVASLITGVIAVGYTKLFNLSEGLLHRALSWHHWLILILAPVNMLIGWAIIIGFAPGARGSGIPQVMAAIELPALRYDKALSKLLSIRVMIVKIISSAFMVLGGAAIGREGPTIQIAGSVFRMVHNGCRVPGQSWRSKTLSSLAQQQGWLLRSTRRLAVLSSPLKSWRASIFPFSEAPCSLR